MNETIKSIKDILDNYSGFELYTENNVIEVHPDNNGFLVSLTVENFEYIVQWGMCHQHYDNQFKKMEEGLFLFWAGLSEMSRLRIYKRGNSKYNWIFEINKDGNWEIIDNTKLIFRKFWKPKTEKVFQNNIIDYKLLLDNELY